MHHNKNKGMLYLYPTATIIAVELDTVNVALAQKN
jgi:hypothetical protein